MPRQFFAQLGLFVIQNFLDAETCARVISEAKESSSVKAPVHKSGSTFVVDTRTRSVRQLLVSDATIFYVSKLLSTLRPTLEEHFKTRLRNIEAPQCFMYRPGDFYKPHRDGYAAAGVEKYFEERRVSVVLFLNDETENGLRNSYSAGALTFYGLIDHTRWKNYGFQMHGEAGLLVAFPARTYHAVETVTAGERYSIATWAS